MSERKKPERIIDGMPFSEYLDRWEQEALASLKPKPKPKPAEIIAGPWPRPKLTEAELIARQLELDRWWERHLLEERQRRTEPSPEQKLSDWIWGRNR
jgi:hypothetical protein